MYKKVDAGNHHCYISSYLLFFSGWSGTGCYQAQDHTGWPHCQGNLCAAATTTTFLACVSLPTSPQSSLSRGAAMASWSEHSHSLLLSWPASNTCLSASTCSFVSPVSDCNWVDAFCSSWQCWYWFHSITHQRGSWEEQDDDDDAVIKQATWWNVHLTGSWEGQR